MDLLIKALLIINLVMVAFAYMTWLERKVLGRMQERYGPNRAGPFGLLQPIADLVKLLRKEHFYPAAAIDVLYIAMPALAGFTALLSFAVIPWGPGWDIGGYFVGGWIVDMPISLILIFALGSIGIYAFMVGGWASESKYSLLGSMRTCAQMVSYEVSLALSVLGVVMMGQSLSLVDIVHKQQETSGSSARRSSASSSSSSPGSPRRTVRRSTSPRPRPSSSRATTPSTAACASASSRRPSTST